METDRKLTLKEKRANQTKRKKDRELFSDLEDRRNKVRSKISEFHGLEREFITFQKNLIRNYETMKEIKHPRDLGNALESLLKNFFIQNQLLPKKYSIANMSIRVASTSGHISNELDLLFYDTDNNFSLMQRENTYGVFPIETCLGTIQVKSTLTKKTLIDALNNIKSFKKLKKLNPTILHRCDGYDPLKSFGVIFAYQSKMYMENIIEVIDDYKKNNKTSYLPNAVVILGEGYFVLVGKNDRNSINNTLSDKEEIYVYKHDAQSESTLYDLYRFIFTLLSRTYISCVEPYQYFQLPLTVGDYSYKYINNLCAEFGSCTKHGDFLRSYSSEKLEKVINWCKNANSINQLQALDIARGASGDDTESYKRQPDGVKIYNPDNLELKDILTIGADMKVGGHVKKIAHPIYDEIECDSELIWIPYYYQKKENLVRVCPKCNKSQF